MSTVTVGNAVPLAGVLTVAPIEDVGVNIAPFCETPPPIKLAIAQENVGAAVPACVKSISQIIGVPEFVKVAGGVSL